MEPRCFCLSLKIFFILFSIFIAIFNYSITFWKGLNIVLIVTSVIITIQLIFSCLAVWFYNKTMLLLAKIWIIIDITFILLCLLFVFIAGSFFEIEFDENYASQDDYVRDTVTQLSVLLYIYLLQYFLLNRARHYSKHPELYSGEATDNEHILEKEK